MSATSSSTFLLSTMSLSLAIDIQSRTATTLIPVSFSNGVTYASKLASAQSPPPIWTTTLPLSWPTAPSGATRRVTIASPSRAAPASNVQVPACLRMVISWLVFVDDPHIGHRPADVHALARAKARDIGTRLLLSHEERPAQPDLVLPRGSDVHHLLYHAMPPSIPARFDRARCPGRPARGGEPNPLGAKRQRQPRAVCTRVRDGEGHLEPVVGQRGGHAALDTPHGNLEKVRLADEVRDELIRRTLVQVFGRPELHDSTLAHDRDPVRHGERFFLVVRDVDHGEAELPLDVLDLELHLIAELLVERAEWLVHEEDRRPVHERARKRHALLLAPAQLRREACPIAGEPHAVQRLLHAPVGLGSRHPAGSEGAGTIVAARHVGKERVVLEHHAEVAPVRGHVREPAATEQDLAGRRRFEAGDHHEGRGLAGATRSEQCQELPGCHREGDVVHREDSSERLGHRDELELGAVRSPHALDARRNVSVVSTGATGTCRGTGRRAPRRRSPSRSGPKPGQARRTPIRGRAPCPASAASTLRARTRGSPPLRGRHRGPRCSAPDRRAACGNTRWSRPPPSRWADQFPPCRACAP